MKYAIKGSYTDGAESFPYVGIFDINGDVVTGNMFGGKSYLADISGKVKYDRKIVILELERKISQIYEGGHLAERKAGPLNLVLQKRNNGSLEGLWDGSWLPMNCLVLRDPANRKRMTQNEVEQEETFEKGLTITLTLDSKF